jgi:serine/threonine protein phosphatase PrpC
VTEERAGPPTLEQPDGGTEVGPEASDGPDTSAGSATDSASDPIDQAHTEVAAADAGEVLEELTFPSSLQPPEPLSIGATIGPDTYTPPAQNAQNSPPTGTDAENVAHTPGHVQIVEQLGARGLINRYLADWRAENGETIRVELREGPADHAGLRREAEILAAVEHAMLPKLYAAFECDGRRYLAIDALEGETLDRALETGLTVEQALSIVVQLAQVVRRLHRAGWALLGLTPSNVVLGEPLRLGQLGHAMRVGETATQALQAGGYSAPELAHGDVVTGKEDVYTLGAILYHALGGGPPPESGAEAAALPLAVSIPGAPQLLAGALTPAAERIEVDALYRGLLALKQRLANESLGLLVASATTVGLNPTRPVNEDSCGYLAWSTATADGASYRALLCVADGMGGMEAGEVASRAAIDAIFGALLGPATEVDAPAERPDPLDPIALIRRAAPAVYAAAEGRAMGTTITCAAVRDGELTLGHVGDTRAYLMRDGALRRLTADHSLVAAMVASGVLTPEEARGHPDSNKVLRSLGSQRELPEGYVDGLEATLGQPCMRLERDDWLVLCSDGVWGSVDDEAIAATVAAGPDCPTVAGALIERALAAGAPDNATAVVARCVAIPAA